MTKGEFLVSIIKSLGYNGSNHLEPDNISLQDDYFEVTANVCEVANRGLTRLFDCNKLPKKSFYITKDTESTDVGGSVRNRYDLEALIEDFGKLNYITYENDSTNVYGKNISVKNEGTYIALHKLSKDSERYVLTYTPKVSRIKDYTPDTEELPYKDEVYDRVVYYVKAELLEETNASLAIHYRNLFEEYVEDEDDEPIEVSRHVRDVYGMF